MLLVADDRDHRACDAVRVQRVREALPHVGLSGDAGLGAVGRGRRLADRGADEELARGPR
jgi:hypothetical protein